MDEQLYAAGFKVVTSHCQHLTTLEISSYASARVVANPNGVLTFEITDVTVLIKTMIPSRDALSVLGVFFGISEDSPVSHDGSDQHDEQVLLFTDELSLEMWLSEHFLRSLDLFDESTDTGYGESGLQIEMLTKKIMVEVLGNKARDQVRREWR